MTVPIHHLLQRHRANTAERVISYDSTVSLALGGLSWPSTAEYRMMKLKKTGTGRVPSHAGTAGNEKADEWA